MVEFIGDRLIKNILQENISSTLNRDVSFEKLNINYLSGEANGKDFSISNKKFDVVFDFQRKFGTSLISWLTQAQIRVGFHRPNGYLLTTPVEIDRHNRQHVIDDYFQLLGVVGIPADDRELELHVSQENRAFAAQKIGQESVAIPGPTLGLFPGASWEFKQWPPQRFVEIGRRYIQDYQGRVLVFGSSAERALSEHIAQQIGASAKSLAGEFRLGQPLTGW